MLSELSNNKMVRIIDYILDDRMEDAKREIEEVPSIDINEVWNKRWSFLMCASHVGNVEMVKYLINKGADPNVKNIDGWTALMFATDACYTDVVEFLLKSGADPNIQSVDGETPLMHASYMDCAPDVQLLLSNRADPTLKDKNGLTAYDIAVRENNRMVINVFDKRKGMLV